MDPKLFLARALNPNVSVASRLYQATNAVLMPFLGRPLGIVHVVEYPKSGGSWIRNMIRSYLGTPAYLVDRLLSRNLVIHTHRRYSWSFPRPVVVVRDPRDLLTSFYHHDVNFEHREQTLSVSATFDHDPDDDVRVDFERYLRMKLFEPTHPWFFYSQFVESWWNRPGVCFVRYEDCLEDPVQQLVKVLRFLDVPVDLDRVEEAVEHNSFKRQTEIRYGAAREAGESDSSKFLRKGVAGDWKNHFNENACRLLEATEGPTLRRLGYVDGDGWVEAFLAEGR